MGWVNKLVYLTIPVGVRAAVAPRDLYRVGIGEQFAEAFGHDGGDGMAVPNRREAYLSKEAGE